jgi:hypothetical protein
MGSFEGEGTYKTAHSGTKGTTSRRSEQIKGKSRYLKFIWVILI